MALVCAGSAPTAVEEDQDNGFLCHVRGDGRCPVTAIKTPLQFRPSGQCVRALRASGIAPSAGREYASWQFLPFRTRLYLLHVLHLLYNHSGLLP